MVIIGGSNAGASDRAHEASHVQNQLLWTNNTVNHEAAITVLYVDGESRNERIFREETYLIAVSNAISGTRHAQFSIVGIYTSRL